jgi:hypothetical protein
MEDVSKPSATTPHAHSPEGRLRLVKPPIREGDSDVLFKKALRSNLLLIGQGTRVSKVLDIMLPSLREPITVWLPGIQLVLPPNAQSGTLILREVGALELGDQHRLHRWIERVQSGTRGTQIVSTSQASLLSRVNRGVFLDTLYYRLNTVYIDVTA